MLSAELGVCATHTVRRPLGAPFAPAPLTADIDHSILGMRWDTGVGLFSPLYTTRRPWCTLHFLTSFIVDLDRFIRGMLSTEFGPFSNSTPYDELCGAPFVSAPLVVVNHPILF